MTRGKDLAKCRLYRESGNASFQAGKFSNAHLLYSISIIFAPVTLREEEDDDDGAGKEVSSDDVAVDKKKEKKTRRRREAKKRRNWQGDEKEGISIQRTHVRVALKHKSSF